MPSPPAAPNKSSDLTAPDRLDPVRWYVVEGLSMGLKPTEIAAKAYRGDDEETKAKRKAMRQRIRNWSRNDVRFAMMVNQASMGVMLLGLPAATQALVRRAQKGRPDAIKLLFEATGFHNPKVKHEHSGDIKVTLDMPRPARVETVDQGEVIEAEVVDEE